MIATRNSSTRNLIETIANELEQADKVLIGAGAGLSAADGFEYGGAWFQEHFGDFVAAYGLTDAYTAGFYPFPDETEKWAYWSRYINYNRYLKEPGSVYQDLLTLVRDKDYFVLTTNVDHCFQRAHFDKQRLFYTQGDYGLWQCATPCHQATYDNHDQVVAMVAQQHDRHIPAELVPRCPRCGGRMRMLSDAVVIALPLPPLRRADDHKPAGRRHLRAGPRLVHGRETLPDLCLRVDPIPNPPAGARGRNEHPGDHKIPVLADDLPQSPSALRDGQPGRRRPETDKRAQHRRAGGHRLGAAATRRRLAAAWSYCAPTV